MDPTATPDVAFNGPAMTCHAFCPWGSVFSAIHVGRHDAFSLLAICSAEVEGFQALHEGMQTCPGLAG